LKNLRVNIITASSPPPPPEGVYYRHLHDYEIHKHKIAVPGHSQYYKPDRDWDWRAKHGHPEVFWQFNALRTYMSRHHQELIAEMNPFTTSKKLRVALDYMRAFTNGLGKGFDTRSFLTLFMTRFKVVKSLFAVNDYVPLQDWFNCIDLTAPEPSMDKGIRLCGGAIVKAAKIKDGWLYPEYIHPDNIPEWIELQHKPWLYFRALNCHVNADKQPTFSNFNQGNGYPLLIPFVSASQPRLPLAVFQRVTEFLDPMKVWV
jgi:hypothetical protein